MQQFYLFLHFTSLHSALNNATQTLAVSALLRLLLLAFNQQLVAGHHSLMQQYSSKVV